MSRIGVWVLSALLATVAGGSALAEEGEEEWTCLHYLQIPYADRVEHYQITYAQLAPGAASDQIARSECMVARAGNIAQDVTAWCLVGLDYGDALNRGTFPYVDECLEAGP